MCCVLQSEHMEHVDSVGCLKVLAATHTLYLSLQVSVLDGNVLVKFR